MMTNMFKKGNTSILLTLVAFILYVPNCVTAQITRTQIVDNANAYTTFTWTAKSTNIWNGSYCGGASIYSATWIRVGSNTSMPYCWGGWSTQAEFTDAMNNNKSAGQVCSSPGGNCSGLPSAPLSCAAGLDCSGLVSRAWGLSSKRNTGHDPIYGLVAISTEINYSQLQAGDIVNKEGDHTRLIKTYYPQNGSALVIEASGRDWRTSTYTYIPIQQTGYTARVYNNVSGGVTLPSPPSLISPGTTSSQGSSITTITPTFYWQPVAGVDQYGFYISKKNISGGYDLIFDSEVRGIIITGSSSSYTLPSGVLVDGGEYRWNMRSHNGAGWGTVFSERLYFYVSLVKTVISSVSPSPTSPAIGNVNQNFNLNISVGLEVASAGYLQVWVYDSDYSTSQKSGVYISSPQSTVRNLTFSFSRNQSGLRSYTIFTQFRPGATGGPLNDSQQNDVTNSIANYQINWQSQTPTQYSVNLSSNPPSGGTTSGGGTYNSGSSVTVTATPSSGYTFSNWTEGGTQVSTSSSYTFSISSNRTLVANFTVIPPTQYSVSLSSNPPNGGTTSGSGIYNSGSSVTVTATSNSGYTFSNWTENGSQVSTSSSYTFTISSNKTLVANFAALPPTQYTVSLSSNPSNGGTTSGGGAYNSGSSVTVTATPNSGYTFSNWTESGTQVSTSSSYTFTISSNRTLVANFTVIPPIQYSISLSSNPPNGGTTSGSGIYNSGSSVIVSATPSSGYTFSNWTESGAQVSTSSSYTFTISGNRTLIANFAVIPPIQYTVSLSSNPVNGGTTSGSGTYNSGSSVTVTATPSSGFTFTNWTENGSIVSTSSNYTFAINNNRTLAANFAAIPPTQYSVNLSSKPASGGTTSGNGVYDSGSGVTVTAAANSGFTFTNWTENESVISTSSSYTFTISSNRTLVANFSASATPVIIVSTNSLPDFGSVLIGQSSSPENFIVSGNNLTSNLVITAPEGFSLSTQSDFGAAQSYWLIPANGKISNTTIYVKFSPTSARVYNAIITNTSSGATAQNISVSGTGSQACSPVTIVTQPQNQSLNSGSTAIFSVSVNGTGPFSYFWFKNEVQVSNTTNTSATTSTYTTPPLTISDNNSYYHCNIVNCNNTYLAYSNNAYLTVLTDVVENYSSIPKFYNLSQNYPNPFNPSTKIKFDIPQQARVKLCIYDIFGREVGVLVDKSMYPGSYEITFDGSKLTSGIYFYRLQTGSFIETKKLILVK